ncbi:hypothetical protein ACTJIJ_08320 [Niabella sp. 22666]|uniref:hypothetical protein n=1 Tax=Niabella sp. 22666 TaxID=3453954 RepID=UPI003F85D06B
MNISATRILLVLMPLFFTELAAQDTLIFKPTKRKPVPDTAIVKVLLVEEMEQVVYIPYEKFSLTGKDSVRVIKNQPVHKKGSFTKNISQLLEIRYDETQKHIIFFNRQIPLRREKQAAYFERRNILTGSLLTLIPPDIRGGYWNRIDTMSDLKNTSPLLIAQSAIERLFCKGIFGIKLMPFALGINERFIGTGFGFRAYPVRQLPTSFFVGFDLLFANSTQYRDIISSKVTQPGNTRVWYSLKQNRNELYVLPFMIGFAFSKKQGFYASIDGAIGMQVLLSDRNTLYNNESYKYRTPAYGQVRLAMGRKF